MKINNLNNFNNIKLNKNNTKQTKVSFAGNNTNLNNNSKKKLSDGEINALLVTVLTSLVFTPLAIMAKECENIRNIRPANEGKFMFAAGFLIVKVFFDKFLFDLGRKEKNT